MSTIDPMTKSSAGKGDIFLGHPNHPGHTAMVSERIVVRKGIEDPTSEQVLKLLESSGTLSFWNEPEEDVYTHDDGEPI